MTLLGNVAGGDLVLFRLTDLPCKLVSTEWTNPDEGARVVVENQNVRASAISEEATLGGFHHGKSEIEG